MSVLYDKIASLNNIYCQFKIFFLLCNESLIFKKTTMIPIIVRLPYREIA